MSTDPTPDGAADATTHLVKRAVRPIDIEHDQLMARADAEHQARTAADQARAASDRAASYRLAADAIESMQGYPRLILPEEIVEGLHLLAVGEQPGPESPAHSRRQPAGTEGRRFRTPVEVLAVHTDGGNPHAEVLVSAWSLTRPVRLLLDRFEQDTGLSAASLTPGAWLRAEANCHARRAEDLHFTDITLAPELADGESAGLRRLADGERDEQQAQGDERRVYAWAQTIDTVDGGNTVCIPGVHHSGGGSEETAILVGREDVPVLAAMLAEVRQEPDDTDLTETDIDRMMAAGVPVQIVTAPPGTRGAVAQQPDTETEAHPSEHTWAAELYDPLVDEWATGTRYLTREHAVNALEHGRRVGPVRKDGTPTQRRLVRATTTYTVETPAAPVAGQPPADTGEEACEVRAVSCSAVVLRAHHAPHDWEPQPGMDRVRCVGYPQEG